jgi:hypothetical protein
MKYQCSETVASIQKSKHERDRDNYFWLPAAGETCAVKEIADLAIYSLCAAVMAHQQTGGRRQRILFIDQFRQMGTPRAHREAIEPEEASGEISI